MLVKYGIDSNGMDTVPLFSLQTHEIQDSDEHCTAEILVRLKNYRTLVVGSLEAMRNVPQSILQEIQGKNLVWPMRSE